LEFFWCKKKREFVPPVKATNYCCEINCRGLTTKERSKKPRSLTGRKEDWIITFEDKELFRKRENKNGKNGKKKNNGRIVPFPLTVNSKNHLFFTG
jgi:hypothetical protein